MKEERLSHRKRVLLKEQRHSQIQKGACKGPNCPKALTKTETCLQKNRGSHKERMVLVKEQELSQRKKGACQGKEVLTKTERCL